LLHHDYASVSHFFQSAKLLLIFKPATIVKVRDKFKIETVMDIYLKKPEVNKSINSDR
jgi:hypothetical protein